MKKYLFIACLALASTLAAETKILALAGSTRVDSYNKKLVREAADIARQMGATVTLIDLKDYPMPFFDEDLEAKEGLPANAQKLRKLMLESDAIMVASPTYNNSVPAVLKNALDWISRSSETWSAREAFKNKKIVLMSASPGPYGGAKGLIHLRAIFENIGGEILAEQVSIASAHTAFNKQGKLESAQSKQQLREQMQKLNITK